VINTEAELAKMQAYLGPCFLMHARPERGEVTQEILIPIYTIKEIQNAKAIDGKRFLNIVLVNGKNLQFSPDDIDLTLGQLEAIISSLRTDLRLWPETAIIALQKNCSWYLESEFPNPKEVNV
jgi:hypothetical protein